ncbi:MAG: sugar ABC transporter ATP-binding protein [Oscillospiraceae bacterium]|nr:sugar ABC transporter ATP-binding protein [Oscillospiraceae bacterium]
MSDIIFSAQHMMKYYGATHANDDVSIELPRGEVRGLIGENGSGKSTLISMIAGMNKRDSGEMQMLGQPYDPHSPLDASNVKIGTVVQELGMVDGLTVGQNIFMGRTDRFTSAGIINLGRMYAEAAELFRKWGFAGFPVKRLVGTLSVEEKKVVELVRALSIDPELLILDEITQALSFNNRQQLLKIIQQERDAGKAILIVTHDIEEMIAITDRVTVMRDGKVVNEVMSKDITPDQLKRMMVGRELNGAYYREDDAEDYDSDVVMQVSHLTAEGFEDVSFELHKREILGLCGLSDAGIHEVAEALFAVRDKKTGDVKLTASGQSIRTPWQAMELKVGYVPKDRDKQALMVNDTIEDNVCLAGVSLTQKKLGFLSPRLRKDISEKVIKKFEVKTNGPAQVLSGLSGGNRQKVNLGRWMIQDKDILILDCPTRGVDVGVKGYIYQMMMEAKREGVSILMISDELPELIGMCDRLIVMKDGKAISQVLRSEGMTEEKLIEVMM